MTDDERRKLERMREAERNWEDFLNPDVVREKFAAVGLFLVAYEILAGLITSRSVSLPTSLGMASPFLPTSMKRRCSRSIQEGSAMQSAEESSG